MTEEIKATPLWQTLPFTKEEKEAMILMMEEEIRDSLRDVAIETLDSMGGDDEDLMELIAYGDYDPGDTAELLHAMADFTASMDDYRSGEHPKHAKIAEYMTRMGLVDDEDRITALGRKYMEAYG